MSKDNVTQAARIVRDLRLDAKAFREHSLWNQDGDEIRLTKNADRLDAAADFIASTKGLVEAVERSANMIDKAASAAAGQDFPALAEALDNIEFRLRQALATYRGEA